MKKMEKTTKYKHIIEFSRAINKHRITVYRLLESKNPDTLEQYADFREKRKRNNANRVRIAQQRIAQLQTA